jgi:hypothetical protein
VLAAICSAADTIRLSLMHERRRGRFPARRRFWEN